MSHITLNCIALLCIHVTDNQIMLRELNFVVVAVAVSRSRACETSSEDAADFVSKRENYICEQLYSQNESEARREEH
jgi:hypothetical protein